MADDTARFKIRWNLGFVAGLVGACVIMWGMALPYLSIGGYPGTVLLTGDIDASLAVFFLALVTIVFCLFRRYSWLWPTGLLVVVAAVIATVGQIMQLAGPDVSLADMLDLYNGILPPGMTAARMTELMALLDSISPGSGLWAIVVGLGIVVLAPFMRNVTAGQAHEAPVFDDFAAGPRRLGRAIPASDDHLPYGETQDLLIDDLHLFADNMEQALSFKHTGPLGHPTHHEVLLLAAGYHGDGYFLRCRDIETGHLRDFAADYLGDIVDQASGETIASNDLLEDLARVAHEAYTAQTQ